MMIALAMGTVFVGPRYCNRCLSLNDAPTSGRATESMVMYIESLGAKYFESLLGGQFSKRKLLLFPR